VKECVERSAAVREFVERVSRVERLRFEELRMPNSNESEETFEEQKGVKQSMNFHVFGILRPRTLLGEEQGIQERCEVLVVCWSS